VRRICRHGERVGACFAVEASGRNLVVRVPEIQRLIDAVGSPAPAVNLDSANYVMCGNDRLQAVRLLGRRIVHTHAKDGRSGTGPDGRTREMSLSAGGVPWTEYLEALRAVDYDGLLTSEREGDPDPGADIAVAAEFLCPQLVGPARA
jgi:sugar phosphate isomerase/epimerase